MSTHIRCPSCGHAAANIAYPDGRWGALFNGTEVDRAAVVAESEDFCAYTFPWDAGREIFECPCERAIWIASQLTPAGQWFICAPKESADA